MTTSGGCHRDPENNARTAARQEFPGLQVLANRGRRLRGGVGAAGAGASAAASGTGAGGFSTLLLAILYLTELI